MYKLADGSLSTDYKIGDEFEVVDGDRKGEIIRLYRDGISSIPYFRFADERDNYQICEAWEDLKPHRKQFTKADLKDGMVVTYRNGEERIVFINTLRDFYAFNKQMALNAFNENLTCPSESSIDIIKVEYMDEVLWEREEETAEQKEIKRLRGVIEDAQKALSKLESE